MARNRSFQNEIPPSRVNIRYVKKVGDALEKVELPLKLLLLGDYNLRPDDTPVEERKRINVDKYNFDSVLKEQGLKVKMTIPNRLSGVEGDEMNVELELDSLKAFEPDEVVQRVPELKKMIEVRNLLTDLKARVITNRQFRLALEKVIKNPEERESIMAELDRIAPLPDVMSGGETKADA
jgi:type VI secretion system protein ImpB